MAEVMLYGTSSPMLVRKIAVTLESWMDMCVIGKIIERCDLWIILKIRWRMSRKRMGHSAKSDIIGWKRKRCGKIQSMWIYTHIYAIIN